jgi:hypothetical protein
MLPVTIDNELVLQGGSTYRHSHAIQMCLDNAQATQPQQLMYVLYHQTLYGLTYQACTAAVWGTVAPAGQLHSGLTYLVHARWQQFHHCELPPTALQLLPGRPVVKGALNLDMLTTVAPCAYTAQAGHWERSTWRVCAAVLR